ncbi:MAG: metallophosphoesterase [Spirochaetaceae bacterium]|nr:metallophosphoesterase [Spirochaetaceae bacterium]
MKYCCSDLHGYFDEFMKLLKKINFTSNDTMYILGDNIDRGPKPIELLKYIYEHDNIISLLGNHEEFLLDYIDKDFDDKDTYSWDKNNGKITRLAINKLHKNDPVLCRSIADNMKTWDSCLILETYILSHAGYNTRKIKNKPMTIESLSEMTHQEFIWSREEFFKYKGVDDYITIFGHTPTRSIRRVFNQKQSDNIWFCEKYEDKIGIDGAIAYGGQINCINLDTMEIIIIDPKLSCA